MIVNTEEIQLEKLQMALGFVVDELHLQQFKVMRFEDYFTDYIRYTCSWRVAAQKAKTTVSTPETWWEHLKERWFSSWMLNRWPVRYKHYRAYRVLPYIALPKHGTNLSYCTFLDEDSQASNCCQG